jgi:hypothetical protein
MNTNTNINMSFFLVDKDIDDTSNNDEEINKMMKEFQDLEVECEPETENKKEFNNISYGDMKSYFEEDLSEYYSKNYTVNQLLKICEYYDLLKCVKMAKYKKIEIINAIILFEHDLENYEIVLKRRQMWFYMNELLNDKYMKKYIIWP